jgi:hypothetical protein
MMVEGISYRDTVIRIADSEFLQDFIRTRKKAVMDHSFLSKCFNVLSALPDLICGDFFARACGRVCLSKSVAWWSLL